MKLRLQKDWNIWGNSCIIPSIFKLEVAIQLMFFVIFAQ